MLSLLYTEGYTNIHFWKTSQRIKIEKFSKNS